MHTSTHIHKHTSIHTCIYVNYTYAYLQRNHFHMLICIYLHTYTNIHILIYAHIYIYTYVYLKTSAQTEKCREVVNQESRFGPLRTNSQKLALERFYTVHWVASWLCRVSTVSRESIWPTTYKFSKLSSRAILHGILSSELNFENAYISPQEGYHTALARNSRNLEKSVRWPLIQNTLNLLYFIIKIELTLGKIYPSPQEEYGMFPSLCPRFLLTSL